MGAIGVKEHLQRMDNYEFEHFVADLWERQGWNCDVSQASADAGIDVTATKQSPYEQKSLIQAKRYGENTTVGGPEIQQYASLKHQQPDADSVIVVTTNRFTKAAKERAGELNVKLIDGDQLEQLVDQLDAHDLLEEYPVEGSYNQSASESSRENTSDWGEDVGWSDSSPLWFSSFERSWQWHRLVPIGMVVWFISLAIAGTLDGSGPLLSGLADIIGYGLVLPLFFLIPIMWYLDMRYVRTETDWNPTVPLYLIGGLLAPYIALPLYYYRRYKILGL